MSRGISSGILILIGMLSFSSQISTEGAVSETSEVSDNWGSRNENVTTHEGDLIINGTLTFVIENCIFIQNGSIHIRDEAELRLKNATLILIMQRDFQCGIYVEDYATVDVDTSRIKIEKWVGTLVSLEQTKVSISNSTLDNVSIDSCGNSCVTVEFNVP